MKIKKIEHIDSVDSYHGLNMEDWFDLNAGKVLNKDWKEIPAKLEGYVEIVKEKKKDGSNRVSVQRD